MTDNNDDMIELATDMKQAYASHYVGSGTPRVLRDIINRYHEVGTETSFDESLSSLMQTRGPYLQALDLPREGPAWSSFAQEHGLHDDVARTFESAGFEHLYEFQGETVQRVLEGDHTLVTAGTGRGKTESWLIPILQFICEAKAGAHPAHPSKSVKCLLTYPTKALAQDQLKRLIEYLFEMNRNRSGSDRITVGIFDGDTPSNDPDEHEYLETVFRFFECPCDACSTSLTVERTEDERFRVTHDTATAPDPELGFIHLTRDDIRADPVDIVLTNPDTVNYRLFNINEEREQELFVSQPKYVVFDEIHEYSELFGAYTSMLMRRYLRTRQELLDLDETADDDLQLLGASATVENRRAIFNRINPFVDPETSIVTEDPQTLSAEIPDTVPDRYTETEVADSDVVQAVVGDEPDSATGTPLPDGISLSIEDGATTDEARNRAEDALYSQLLTHQGDELDFVRALYTTLYETPKEPETLLGDIQSSFDLAVDQAETLLSNFVTIGQLSGILESRVHLFSWPIDGFYTCLQCATVYDTPQGSCDECGHTFVTKLSYCSHCGEEALESWFCPACERLSPLTVTSHGGRFEYFETQSCPCGTEMIRTIWRPFYECTECGETQQIDRVQACPSCDDGTSLVLSSTRDQYQCSNPDCELTTEATELLSCGTCENSTLEPKAENVHSCPDCGETASGRAGDECPCGGELEPRRFLGWQCNAKSCAAVYFGETPSTCECGNRRFARTALFDVNQVEECDSCGRDLFPEQGCFCGDSDTHSAVRGYTEYKQVDERGEVRKPTDFPGAVPCYDRGQSYGKSDRYQSMLRGPGNTAVTSAQYLLRAIADRDDPASFSRAKLLSFADSQSDMKELTRDFNEPEEDLFFTQLVIDRLEAHPDPWQPLADLQTRVWEEAQAFEADLQTELDPDASPVLGSLTRYGESTRAFVDDEVSARILTGRFNDRWTTFLHLPSEGLVNVRLAVDVDSLSAPKRAVLEEFHAQRTQYISALSETINGAGRYVDELIEDGVLEKLDSDSGVLVGLNPAIVECALVSEDVPIAYDPVGEQFSTEFDQTCAGPSEDLVPFTANYQTRSDITSQYFDLTAYRVATSDPMRLLGKAYFGGTEAKERREIEYQFREGRYPHFLSSGPAMELGVDIGDLNSLLLYGTPPNMNSYLQRVGRAGRESGSSLVHSVSQRNPIDYYYFEQPSELIQAGAQPVPLNETNEAVLTRSLTWAILDCIAATQWVPIRREESAIQDAFVYERDAEPIPRTDPRPNNIETFSTLLMNSSAQLQPGAEISPLEGIRDAIGDSDGPRSWLRDLLRFASCNRCGRKHAEGHTGPCDTDGCDGTPTSVLATNEALVDTAIDAIESELLDAYVEFEDELFEELDHLESQVSDLRRSSRTRRRQEGDSDTDTREQLERLRQRRTQLDTYLQRLEDQSFGDFLSAHSDTNFNIRSVSDTVTYELVGTEYEHVTTDPLSRDIQLALSELHPGAAYLHSDNEIYVVTELIEDAYATSQIRGKVPDEAICPTCGSIQDIDDSDCDACGRTLKRLETVVPSRVRAFKHDLPMDTVADGKPLSPDSIYAASNQEIQSTYAPVDRQVVDFDPVDDKQYVITDSDGEERGTIAYGRLQVRSTATHFFASYQDGGSDPLPTVFEQCGRDNCTGMIARTDDRAYCTRDSAHDPSDSTAIRLAAEFETVGVRVQLESEELEHTLVHGLRVALQYIGGVGVRKIPETVENDGTYVYDGDEGGSGITALLLEGAGEPESKFQKALDIIAETFECDCDTGCPYCVFQYGCTEHNDPESFDTETIQEWIDAELRLVPH